MVRVKIIVALALAVLFGGFVLLLYLAQSNVAHSVAMTDDMQVAIVLTPTGYEPKEVRVKKGTTVLFTTTIGHAHWPSSDLHPSHMIYAEFDPKRPLKSDEAWSFGFDKVGTWGFHDHIRAYFTGVIYVEE